MVLIQSPERHPWKNDCTTKHFRPINTHIYSSWSNHLKWNLPAINRILVCVMDVKFSQHVLKWERLCMVNSCCSLSMWQTVMDCAVSVWILDKTMIEKTEICQCISDRGSESWTNMLVSRISALSEQRHRRKPTNIHSKPWHVRLCVATSVLVYVVPCQKCVCLYTGPAVSQRTHVEIWQSFYVSQFLIKTQPLRHKRGYTHSDIEIW